MPGQRLDPVQRVFDAPEVRRAGRHGRRPIALVEETRPVRTILAGMPIGARCAMVRFSAEKPVDNTTDVSASVKQCGCRRARVRVRATRVARAPVGIDGADHSPSGGPGVNRVGGAGGGHGPAADGWPADPRGTGAARGGALVAVRLRALDRGARARIPGRGCRPRRGHPSCRGDHSGAGRAAGACRRIVLRHPAGPAARADGAVPLSGRWRSSSPGTTSR